MSQTSPKGRVDSEKPFDWEDQITDSESEDVPCTSIKLKRKDTEEDLYLKIIKEDGNIVDDFSSDKKSIPDGLSNSASDSKELITLDDKDSCEDEKVNQYLDDIERKLEENIKKKTPHKDKDNWKVVDYFQDIICVKDDGKSNITLSQNRDRKYAGKRRRPAHTSPSQNESIKRSKNKLNVSLSDGEILSDEDLILSDVSLSPEPRIESVRHRKTNLQSSRRGLGSSRNAARPRQETSTHSKHYSKSSRYDKQKSRYTRDIYESSGHSPVYDVRDKRRIVQILPESVPPKYSDQHHHHRSYHYKQDHLDQKDDHRRHSSPEPHRETARRRSIEKHKSKKHKTDSKREGKLKSSTDYFDEEKYYGSDKFRIRNLKKKYNEYLKYAKKFKNEDQNSDHIEKFVKMRSRLKREDSTSIDEKQVADPTQASIDYKKEEEKFLRSLETYLEIKKKQEKSMSTGTESLLSSGVYDPETISSEEEEYVPEKFTPEDISVGNVEEYDPCTVTNTSVPSITYNPTKIDEYEPVTLRLDEEYCPMPVQNSLPLTYNPTKMYETNIPFQFIPTRGTRLPFSQFPGTSKQNETKPGLKVVSKNTVFIGNAINPIALNSNANLILTKPPSVSPNSIDKTKIMSKLVNEKLLEIERKKLQLLEEINRKKLLKIKEKCDEVELRNLEKWKTDLIEELNMKTNENLKSIEIPTRNARVEEKLMLGTKTVVAQSNVQKQGFSLGFNTIQIKQEKSDMTDPPVVRVNEKLDALEKKKAELLLEIEKKMLKNTEIVNKEKAEVTSRLQELEKNKAALLAELERKETEKRKDLNPAVKVKIEKGIPTEINTTGNEANISGKKTELFSLKENTIQIKQEKDKCIKGALISAGKSIPIGKINDSKTKPLVNEKLSELEAQKAKLMAAIAAKSNKMLPVPVIVKKENIETQDTFPDKLNEKLTKLAQEKEQLLAEIEKKRSQRLTQVQSSNEKSNLDIPSTKENEITIKKEREDISNIERPKIKSEKDLKDNTDAHNLMSHEDLAAKINQLRDQKTQLMQTLAKKLPQNNATKSSKVFQRSSISSHVKVSNNKHKYAKSPNPIASLAGQVKLKVDQQLFEITKKRMELMKQINSKSSNPQEITESGSISSSTDTGNVREKLLELERSKLKLLMEINKKTSSDKENIVSEVQDTNENLVHNDTDCLKPSESKEDINKEKTNIVSSHADSSECLPIRDDAGVFKVPAIPKLKRTIKSRGTIRKNKIIKPKLRLGKHQRLKMKALLNKNKVSMVRKFRKLKALRSLWGNLDNPVGFTQNVHANNESTSVSTSESISSTSSRNVSSMIQCETIVHTDPETASVNKVINGKSNIAESDKLPVERLEDTSFDDVDILELPPPDPKHHEVITLHDEDQDTLHLQVGDENESKTELLVNIETEDEAMSGSEFITLKFIKVEKLSDLDGGDNGNDDENNHDNNESNHLHQCDMKDQLDKDTSSDANVQTDGSDMNSPSDQKEKKTENINYEQYDIIDVLDTNTDLAEEYHALQMIEEELVNVASRPDDFVLDDVIILEENSISDKDITPIEKLTSSSSMYQKNALATIGSTSSTVVSRLILNNKRKLISGQMKLENKRKLLKQNVKSSKFKFVRSTPLDREHKAPIEKHPSKLDPLTRNSLIQPKSDEKNEQLKKELKRNFRNKPSVYKFEKETNRYQLENRKFKSKNGKYKLERQENSSNTLALKLSSIRDPSVISKFKLVRNKSNAKLNNYKTLPLSIRRQVANSLSQTSSSETSPLRSSGYVVSKRKSERKLSRSKYKLSKLVESSQNDRKLTKSKYKLWRNPANTTRVQEARLDHEAKDSTSRIVRKPNTPRKSISLRSPGVKYSQPKLNHLVSKYKMVRISNQRERNKLNLSQRVQESSYPNRTMKVIKLNGASYKVSSRSLHRKISTSLDTKVFLPVHQSPSASTVTRRSSKVWHLRDNIFSNRQIIGRTHLTSSRLRSLAVLTSRLRKNNVQLSMSQSCSNPATPRLQVGGNRGGFLKGSHGTNQHEVDSVRAGNIGSIRAGCYPARQMYRNLSYTSPSEILKSRRTSRHRLQRRNRARQAVGGGAQREKEL